ncbi:MAG: ATP-binding protein [Gammaproteobacteria bacterium]|nr:ATP-binding protein [Gammaproteobacteria bacterium]MDH5651483.1 ATP-binding protein [Gammaproteobacteria bacterium]
MQSFLFSPIPSTFQDDSVPGNWRLLKLLNIYRLALAGLLILLFVTDYLFPPLASQSKFLFVLCSVFYFTSGLRFHRQLRRRVPRLEIQIVSHIGLDILIIILLIHASGGVDSGLGSLLVLPIACGSILTKGRAALVPAAVAAIMVLLQVIISDVGQLTEHPQYIHAGVLGLTYFATTVLVILLSRRLRESEDLARKRSVDLANMSQLTEHIIQRMQTGIIVIDAGNEIRLINESAWHMLGMPATSKTPRLSQVSPELHRQITLWQENPDRLSEVIRPTPTHVDIMPRFAQVGNDATQGVLIYLEDTSAMTQHAQQLQLAALGRLTASIAHEIRNPLGAISHAGQLLSESPNLDDNDQRLTRIIGDHTQRLNTIVTNIMQISRRNSSHIERFRLKPFVERCVSEFLTGQTIDPGSITIHIDPEEVDVRCDPSHLQQILVNLCDNGLHHGKPKSGTTRLQIRGGVTPEFQRPFLDIIDNGPGIAAEEVPHIFEPFFTTSPIGTGLGLYISRQLAECNQAHLNYVGLPTGGACFRITFQDPRRNIY